MNRSLSTPGLQRMHSMLVKEWGQHEDRIRTTWSVFTAEERSRCYRSTVAMQRKLFSPGDPTDNPDLTPEWTNIAVSGAQYFLDLAELRATRSLYQQAFQSFKDFESGYSHVVQMVSKVQASLKEVRRNDRMLFVGEKQDGAVVDIAHTTRLGKLAQHDEHAVGVRGLPMACGDLLTWRQLRFLASIIHLVYEILEWGPESSVPSKKANDRYRRLLGFSIRLGAMPGGVEEPSHVKMLLPELIARALDFVCATEESKDLLESSLNHFSESILQFFYSEPGRTEEGARNLTTAEIGAAFFDCMNHKTKILCIWQYIVELLCLLHSTFDEKTFRHMVLQQLLGAVRLAYTHMHKRFLGALQIDTARSVFRKINRFHQSKGKSKHFPVRGSLMHHLFYLAEQETFADTVSELFSEINTFTLPGGNDSVYTGEHEALTMLMQVVSFIDDLALALHMPLFPWLSGSEAISRFEQVGATMSQARLHVDIKSLGWKSLVFGDLSLVKSCHAKRQACTRKHAGDSLLGAYEGAVNDCLLKLKLQRVKENKSSQSSMPSELLALAEAESPAQPEPVVVEAKEKKTPVVLPIEASPFPASILEDGLKDLLASVPVPREEVKEEVKLVAVHGEEAEVPVSILGDGKDKSDLSIFSVETDRISSDVLEEEMEKEMGMAVAAVEAAMISLRVPTEAKKEENVAASDIGTANLSTSVSTEKRRKKSKSATKPQPKIKAPSTAEKLPRTPVGSPGDKIPVSSTTARVFSILFDKSLSRCGLHWASFEAAMAELEFRITPRQGSSILFEPPASLGLGRSLTIHRPHGSRSEGFRTVVLRQRLNRAFGWDHDTFVAR